MASQPSVSQPPPEPRVPAPVRTATEAVFSGLARLRDARPFHPRGASFTAVLTPRRASSVPGLGSEPRQALVRLSNAAGMPAWLPDVFGLAVRIPEGAGPGRPLDLLLSSSLNPPGLRHLLAPGRGFDGSRFSTLLLYRDRGEHRLLGARYSGPPLAHPLRLEDVARIAEDGTLRFALEYCTPGGPWQQIADLQIGAQLPPPDSASLRFHPWNVPPELRPIGALNHIRAAAYEVAQRTSTSE